MCTSTGLSLTNPSEIRSLGVNPQLKYATGPKRGQVIPAEEQRKAYVASLIQSIKRPQNKLITAKATAAANSTTVVLGNSYGLSADADAGSTAPTWTFQNPVGKTAFNAAVNGSPFRYLGLQIDVSDEGMFNTLSFTELINDYDVNVAKDFGPQVDAGINTLALNEKTRFINVGGEFNGFYGLKAVGLSNGQWIKYSFYCVAIQRGW